MSGKELLQQVIDKNVLFSLTYPAQLKIKIRFAKVFN